MDSIVINGDGSNTWVSVANTVVGRDGRVHEKIILEDGTVLEHDEILRESGYYTQDT